MGGDGHAQHVVGLVPGAPVDLRIESRIGVGVGYVDRRACGEAFAGDPGVAGEPDFLDRRAAGDAGIQLAPRRVVQKQRTAVGFQKQRRRVDDLLQQRLKEDFGGDGAHHFEQQQLLALRALHFLEYPGVLERRGRLMRQRLEQLHILGVEIAPALVERLGDADHLLLPVADGNAQDVARTVPGAPVHIAVEAGIGIGVGDDLPASARKHRAGDAERGPKAHLAHNAALHHAGKQLAGLRVMEKQGAAVRVEHFGHHFHQAGEQDVQ